MDPDIVVQYVTRGLLLLGAALLTGLVATWLVGHFCRRAALSSGRTALAQIVTPVALLYGASLYLDVAGAVAAARVITTEERITYGSRIPGVWNRSFWAVAAFTTSEGARQAPLWIDEATYDALRPGSSIRVRYLAWLPLVARPADQSTRAFVPWRWLAIGLLALGAIVALRPLLRRSPWLTALVILVGLGAAIVWWIYPTPWESPLEPPVLTAMAEVRRVHTITVSLVTRHSEDTVEAPQPWQLVELQFVPAGRERPVIALDGVDVGSTPGLQVGARLPVRYSGSRPREARLSGTRTWRWREWGELGEYALGAVAILGGFLLLTKGMALWRRRTIARS